MKAKTLSPEMLRKRKFLFGLPVLLLPFITLLFWALGGGRASTNQVQKTNLKQGLNTQLPDANLKDDKPLDKLSYYEKAALDSAKLKGLLKNDRYYLENINGERGGAFKNDSMPVAVKYKSK